VSPALANQGYAEESSLQASEREKLEEKKGELHFFARD
jgi:hypothetical protein